MLKNAIAYILRKRSRTVIIFIILTIVLSCLYSCLNIMKSTISLLSAKYGKYGDSGDLKIFEKF